jgi:sensor histidine kinase regulating citrate/malate metabolism
MSLRGRLLAAFAYTLLIVLVALEVPLGQNLSDRVNSEVEVDATSQAEVVAAEALTSAGCAASSAPRPIRSEDAC